MRLSSEIRAAAAAALVAACALGVAFAAPDEVAATRLADTTVEPPTYGGSRPRECTRVGDLVFFAAETDLTGRELFVTDGTELGTRMVVELVPGAVGSSPHDLIADDGFIWFRAETAARGIAAWRSDGTAAGTVPVDDVLGGPEPPGLIPGSNDVRHLSFFAADDDERGRELFRSDGTVDGTYLLADINTGAPGSFPGQFTRVGDVVFFTALTAKHGFELWKTDGTPVGTVLVKDINPGSIGGSARHLANLDERVLLFSAWDDVHGSELWISDGTEQGTHFVADLAPRAYQSGDPHDFRDVGDGTAYFAAATDLSLIELWRTDGTAEGTYLVADIEPDRPSGVVDDVVRIADGVVFSAGPVPGEFVLSTWGSDGTTVGTVRWSVAPASTPQLSSVARFAGGAIAFVPERELLVIDDHTGAGTRLAPPVPAQSSNRSGRFIPFGDRMIFQIDEGQHPFWNSALWITDGTLQGTVRIGPTERASSIVDDHAVLGGHVYMAFGGNGLERIDGTPGNTLRIPVASAGTWGSNSVAALSDHVAFVALDPTSRVRHVFSYSPTANTLVSIDTVEVRQFETSAALPSRSLWDIGAAALFVRADADEIWKTDGTVQGTAKVADLQPGWGDGAAPSDIEPIRVGSRVMFAAVTPEHGHELWCLEDGVVGASLVADVAPGPADSRPNGLLALGSSEYAVFAASDPEHGMELWITDGTADGTHLLSDVRPGPQSSNPRDLTQTGTSVFFVADGDAAGEEPWSVSLVGLALPESAFDGSDGFPSVESPVGVAPDPLDLERLRVKLDFRRRSRDSVTLKGVIALPSGFERNAAVVVVQIAEHTQRFTLNRKGRGREGRSRFRLGRSSDPDLDVRFTAELAGDLQGALAAAGLTEDTGADPIERSVRVSVVVDGMSHGSDVRTSYRVRRRRGKAVQQPVQD